MKSDTISRLYSVQLFADSHDQGDASEPEQGNWTWFELVILDKEHKLREKDGVKLVWKSHLNRFLTNEFGWVQFLIRRPRFMEHRLITSSKETWSRVPHQE